MVLIFIIFVLLSWYAGYIIVEGVIPKFPKLFLLAAAFLVGTAIAVPITYILSCSFVRSSQPLLWGTIATIVLLGVVSIRYRRRIRLRFSFEEVVFFLFAFGFSSWIMFKTFHGNSLGFLFVGSNNIFDFGLSLGLIRSISQGANIPFGSPFFAGFPMFYHFFFPFYCALWEYFGIPTVWAINGPSILSFAALLTVIFSMPEAFGIKGRLVSWIGVFLTITHPTLTFWKYMFNKGISIETIKGLWQIPTYPFAGPFDGSAISIFMTLNNYINQRHLSFAIALGLVLYAVAWQRISQTKKIPWSISALMGASVGALFYWNIVICVATAITIFLLHAMYNKVKSGIVFASVIAVVLVLSLLSHIPTLIELAHFVQFMSSDSLAFSKTPWSFWTYLWENLGILPFVAGIGYVVFGKRRKPLFPVVVMFIFVILFAAYHNRGFDQKLLSLFIIPINILAAIGFVWIWNRKLLIAKIIALSIFITLTISGVVDLLVVKNEFAYPVISSENISVISWIQQQTPKNSVFVSYADMIDPVALAGRKNYFGFYGNVGWEKRNMKDAQRFYSGDTKAIKISGLSYILVPKWEKSDFPYVVDEIKLRKLYPVAYEDKRFLIFDTHLSMIQ